MQVNAIFLALPPIIVHMQFEDCLCLLKYSETKYIVMKSKTENISFCSIIFTEYIFPSLAYNL